MTRTYEEQQALVPTLFSDSSQLRLRDRTDGIDAIINLHEANKAPLMQMLGFTERPWKFTAQGGPQFAVVHFPISTQAIKYALPDDFKETIGDNLAQVLADNNFKVGKHEYKVSRYLIQRLEHIRHSDIRAYKSIVSMMHRALTSELKYKGYLTASAEKGVIDLFVQSFFSEYKASATGQRLEISFELDDILDAGLSNHGWGSCFKWGGINERGSLYVATAAKGGVIRNYGAKGQLIGRAWIYVADDEKSIHILKPYGFLPNNLLLTAGKFLANKLSPNNLWVPGLDISADGNSSTFSYLPSDVCALLPNGSAAAQMRCKGVDLAGWYTDPCSLRLYRDDFFVGCSLLVTLTRPPCAFCGNDHSGSATICRSCRSSRFVSCSACGNRVHKEMAQLFGNTLYLCKDCSDAGVTLCVDCGRRIGPGSRRGDRGRCFECSSARTCSLCGSTSNVSRVSGYPVCAECLAACDASTCYVCGADFNSNTQGATVGQRRICKECATVVCDKRFVDRVIPLVKRAADVDGKLMRAVELSLKLQHKELDVKFVKKVDSDTYSRVVLPTVGSKGKKSTHWSPKSMPGFTSLKPSPQLTRFCYHTNLFRGRR